MMNIKLTAMLLAGLLLSLNLATSTSTHKVKNISRMSVKVPAFVGHWKLNVEASQIGEMPLEFAYTSIQVKQTGDSISLIRSSMEIIKQGNIAVLHNVALNGGPSSYYSTNSKRTKTSSITLSNDGKSMIETASFKYDEVQKEGHQTGYVETWTLSADGKTLTIVRDMKVSTDKFNWITKCVYEKDSI